MRLGAVEKRFAALETQLRETKTAVGEVKTKSEASTRAAGRTLAAIRDELDKARRNADEAVGEAKATAELRVRELATELASREGNYKQHRQELQRLKSEISRFSDAASKADERIGEVKTEVAAVKSALEADRTAVERAVSDLRRVKGDLGVQSGLIATNARELATLKSLNERNYFDIDLRTKAPQIVSGVTFLLKKVDPKRLRFSVEVIAADKKTEKKDRLVNEPVQFLVSKTKGPYQLQVDDLYELVVNTVTRDSVQGYLTTPKPGPNPSLAVR
jgi:chromosome segregation ATPase